MNALLLGVVLAQVSPAPGLSVAPATVNLNPAQQQVLTVTGAVPPVEATLDQRLVNAIVSSDGTTVTITATQATGSDVLHVVDANGAQAQVPIRVAFNAGTIVPQTSLTVTGNAVDPDWLARQVTRRVRILTQAQPGARVTLGAVTPPAAPLSTGQSAQLVVPVQIAGNGDYFDQTGATTVDVQDVAAAPFEPGLLFYDDDPEHVGQDGVLFRGTVGTTPARLFYYHDDVQEPRRLVVALTTTAQATALQLLDVVAGPNIDVMTVGQTLSKNFLLTKSRAEGLIVNLSPDAPYVLADVPMTPQELVSGTVDLRVLSGGPIALTVLAVSPGVDPRTLLDGPVLAGDGHHRTGVFQITDFGSHALAYAAGGPDAVLTIGDTDPTPPSADPNAAGHDYGDYGVVHSIDLALSNPGASPATAYLYFRPLAGPARGSFLVGSDLVEIGCVRVSTPYQVASFQLAPGQTYRTVVRTMTDGASFYPAQIGVTATPPQPAAPPITAPDGCFPKPQAPAAPQ